MSHHVVTAPSPAFAVAGGQLWVHQVPLGKDNLGWVLQSPSTGQCAVVDGPEAGPYLELITARGWTLTTVMNTHTHDDHIGVNLDLQRRGLLAALDVIGCRTRSTEIPGLTTAVDEGDVLSFCGVSIEVWRTEGHINGHLSFVVDGAVFCGDTMFGAGCGYLFDGPPEAMHASLQRLASLPPHTKVCCAHEYTEDNLAFALTVEPDNPALWARRQDAAAMRARGEATVPSTIELERMTNPFVRAPHVESMLAHLYLSPSSTPAERFHAARKMKDSKLYKLVKTKA